MSAIRPISDLRYRSRNISEECHNSSEPVFIQKNGKIDLVVMSSSLFDKQLALLELYKKLLEAESERNSTNERKSHESLITELRDRINKNNAP
jgi:PHD/YefM family antitoxin component YafN of YafNO toxin-antitoxin module